MASTSTSTKPVTLLTGASRGLGLSIAQLLLEGRAAFSASRVVTISRSTTPELEALAARFPDDLINVRGDVSAPEVNERAVRAATDAWGRIDALVLNAGIVGFARIADLDPAQFATQLNVNTIALVTTVRAAIQQLRNNKGRVVFVSSGAATGNIGGWAAYNASKAAMNSICRTLANEEPELACFAIRPGVIDTNMQAQIRTDGHKAMLSTEMERFLTTHNEGKLLRPEQPAHTIAALAVKGTRTEPKTSDGKGVGEVGGFINWDAPEMDGFKL